VVVAQDGRELRFVLTGTGDGPLRVTVELSLPEGGPPLEVVELDPVEVLQAAAVLRRLAMESREGVDR
jgi:hypothetical protein